MGDKQLKHYMRVDWHHDFDDEPVVIYSEIDAGRETRKVEIYRDGHRTYADEIVSTGDTSLSQDLMPTVSEISESDEFTAEVIPSEVFSNVWRDATQQP
jgi:hypothetical protein